MIVITELPLILVLTETEMRLVRVAVPMAVTFY